jgi:hypothetical protein
MRTRPTDLRLPRSGLRQPPAKRSTMGPMSSGFRSAPVKSTLGDVPIAHALIHARNTRLSGTIELASPDGRRARIDVWRGLGVASKTTPHVATFGDVAYELGLIDAATLDAAGREAKKRGVTEADVLVERRAVTVDERRLARLEQLCRRIHYAFTFPAATSMAFFEVLPDPKPPPSVIDLLRPTWRGLLDYPLLEQVGQVLARLGDAPLSMINEAALETLELGHEERRLCETLLVTPLTLEQLRSASRPPRQTLDLLVYLLVISRCLQPLMTGRSASSRTIASPAAAAGMAPRAFDLPLVETPRERLLLGPADLDVEGVRARAARIAYEGAEEALGLPQGASAEATRAAYLRLARLWNPQRLPEHLEQVRAEVESVFVHLGQAYRLLTERQARSGS